MLVLLVVGGTQPIITADGKKMRVRQVQIRRDRQWWALNNYTAFTNVRRVRIVLKTWKGLKRIKKHAVLEQGIAKFLNQYHAKTNMEIDCYSFVNLVYGIESHSKKYLLKYWTIRDLKGYAAAGEVIFFTSGERHFHHAAICIGHGLYISVWGAGGDLEVATLKDMKRDFGAQKIMSGTPKL